MRTYACTHIRHASTRVRGTRTRVEMASDASARGSSGECACRECIIFFRASSVLPDSAGASGTGPADQRAAVRPVPRKWKMGGFFVLRANKVKYVGFFVLRSRKIADHHPIFEGHSPIFEEIAPPPPPSVACARSSFRDVYEIWSDLGSELLEGILR